MNKGFSLSHKILPAIVLCAVVVLGGKVFAHPVTIDPEAEELLASATRFLSQQQSFSVDTSSTYEVVLTSGQKIQFDQSARLVVQRPDKLFAERHGDVVDQVFYYDGKLLTLFNPGERYYATLPAPDTIETMLDLAREELDIMAPAGDLIYSNAFEILMEEVTEGIVVGKSVVDGVRCVHLAFRSLTVDWQIWIQEGVEPLPRKFVITTKDVVNAPQFAVVMRNWNLQPDVGTGTFQFKPPAGATEIEFLPARAGTVSYR